jgi:hypothetical protein
MPKGLHKIVKGVKRTARKAGKRVVSGKPHISKGEINPWAVATAKLKEKGHR